MGGGPSEASSQSPSDSVWYCGGPRSPGDKGSSSCEAAREAAEPDPPFPFLPRNPVLARLGARPCNDPLPDGTTPSGRWPHLFGAGWLLPLDHREETRLATMERAEGAWDLGYRGLLPRSLAIALAPASAQDRSARILDQAADRALLRRQEKCRRRALTARFFRGQAASVSPDIDLFGEPLDREDEEHVTPEDLLSV